MKRIAALLAAIALALWPISAWAIADPDAGWGVQAVYVYEDLLEAGDVGVLVEYNLVYAALPSEDVTDTYLVAFVDTDGTTQLKAVAPYAWSYDTFDNRGYRRALAWLYFTPAEVTTYALTSASSTLYRIWLMGNPLATWVGDPPKQSVSINTWYTTGDPNVLLALRVLYYAQELERAWALSNGTLIQTTSLGSRLTSVGETYFVSVTSNLRDMAPTAFSSGTLQPTVVIPDYRTSFGATMTNVTGVVAGSPITLAAGAQDVNVTGAGTFTLTLNAGTVGTVVGNTGTVTGDPVDLVAGINTITVPGGGTGLLTVTVNLQNTQTNLTDATLGTGFDVSGIATTFGMSRLMFGGLLWLGLSIAICAAAYKRVGQKTTMLLFNLCIIGGLILGLLSIVIGALLFILFGGVTGWALWGKRANY